MLSGEYLTPQWHRQVAQIDDKDHKTTDHETDHNTPTLRENHAWRVKITR
jgi:hypothetical protein